MQNVDFSRMINRKAPERPARPEEPRYDRPASSFSTNFSPTVGGGATSDIKRSNRTYVLAVAFAIIAFTGGIMAGMKLAEFRQLENKIVKYPDGKKPEGPTGPASQPPGEGGPVSFPTPGEKTPATGDTGKYLIKIGTFAPEEADQLVTRLNHIRELDPVRPLNCKHVTQTVPRRKLAFTIPLGEEDPKKNVFVGCFADQGQAGAVVNILTSSGLPGTSQAKLYEIE